MCVLQQPGVHPSGPVFVAWAADVATTETDVDGAATN
jgi:hypothetical protein